MSLIIREKATYKEIQEMSKCFRGYIKIVVDVKREVLAGGGDRHFDDEKILLLNGSKQENLWGGGFDMETKEIDYNSIINLRPSQENPSRDIFSFDIRKKFAEIVRKLLI